MNLSTLVISMMLFSGMAVGMTTFYAQTASKYSADTSQISQIEQEFNQFDYINGQVVSIQSALNTIDPENPFTWGNLLGVLLGVMSLLVSIPGLLQTMINSAITINGIIPPIAAIVIEGVILTIIVFKMLQLMTNTGGGNA